MFIRLVVLILALTLDRRVHTVIGGKEAVPHSRPYMVFLERLHEDNSKTYCDGFLLNEEFVVTAANCKAKSYIAWLGADNIQNRNDMQRVSVEEAFPHKDYSPAPNLKNDIMLLKLSSKVKFTENVKSIVLADQGDGPLPNSCLVSGWGLTGEDMFLSDVLMEVNVTLSDDKRCVGQDWYCSVGNTGPDEGDSGGPLVCEDGKAYGVVSSKKNPGTTDELPLYVFTKIPDYISWIISIFSLIEHRGRDKDTTIFFC
ncbi:mast cell protease 2-like [Pagrus major]|uniref:mast cell protease 2-like n=1 Tax=Pagrus major TaxID=143350 RepID=UPI003CC892A0